MVAMEWFRFDVKHGLHSVVRMVVMVEMAVMLFLKVYFGLAETASRDHPDFHCGPFGVSWDAFMCWAQLIYVILS